MRRVLCALVLVQSGMLSMACEGLPDGRVSDPAEVPGEDAEDCDERLAPLNIANFGLTREGTNEMAFAFPGTRLEHGESLVVTPSTELAFIDYWELDSDSLNIFADAYALDLTEGASYELVYPDLSVLDGPTVAIESEGALVRTTSQAPEETGSWALDLPEAATPGSAPLLGASDGLRPLITEIVLPADMPDTGYIEVTAYLPCAEPPEEGEMNP